MFKNWKLGSKLLAGFLFVGTISIIGVGAVSLYITSEAIREHVVSHLESVREIKKAQVEKYFSQRKGDMGVLLETVATLRQNAFQKLEALQDIKKTQTENYVKRVMKDIDILSQRPEIKRLYSNITNYLMIEDQGDKDEIKPDSRVFNEQFYTEWEPYLSGYTEQFGYGDLYVIKADTGHVIFSLKRKDDLGTNLQYGPYKETGLAKLWQKVMTTNATALADFSDYPPEGGKHVAFAGAPVSYLGDVVAVVALEMTIAPVNAIVQQKEGAEKSARTYLIGKDNQGDAVLRSDIGDNKKDKLNIGDKFATPFTASAMSGESGRSIFGNNEGRPVIVAYDPISMGDFHWTLISSVDFEEVISPKLKQEDNDFLTKFIQKFGYDNLMLINSEGYCFYDTRKNAAYRANFLAEPFSGSHLGRLIQKTFDTKDYGISDFAVLPADNGQPSAFIAQPLLNGDDVEVIVAVKFNYHAVNAIMQQREGMGKTGETYLVGKDGLMRSNSFRDPEKHSVIASFSQPEAGGVRTRAVQKALAGNTGQEVMLNYQGNQVISAYAPVRMENIVWALIAEMDEDDALKSLELLKLSMLCVAGLSVIVIIFTSLILSRSLMRPVKGIVSLIQKVSEGEFIDDETGAVDPSRTDEVGQMINAVSDMKKIIQDVLQETDELIKAVREGKLENRARIKDFRGGWKDLVVGVNGVIDAFVAPISMTAANIDRISRGDIPPTIKEEYQGDFNTIKNNLNTMIQNLVQFAMDVQSAAEQVAAGAEEVSSGADQISQGTAHQSAGVEEITSSMEEMSATVNQNAENSKQTAGIAEKAARDAQEGSQAVNNTIQAMKTITEKILIIEEIAGQTNMLALNAAIEAARAGAHGKGFSVVASEIRDLAKNTGSAAKDINSLSMANIEIAEKTGSLLENMVSGIQKTADLVQDISLSSTEQADGIEEVNKAMQQLDQIIQKNAASTEEMATSSREFSSQAERLLEVASFFKISDEFKKQMRDDSDAFSENREQFYNSLHEMSESDIEKLVMFLQTVIKKKSAAKQIETDDVAEMNEEAKTAGDKDNAASTTPGKESDGFQLKMKEPDDNEFEMF